MTVASPDAELTQAGPAVFDPLDTRELDVLIALIRAGWATVSAVHPLLCPLWHDARDLMIDLDLAWWHSFGRENPDRVRR